MASAEHSATVKSAGDGLRLAAASQARLVVAMEEAAAAIAREPEDHGFQHFELEAEASPVCETEDDPYLEAFEIEMAKRKQSESLGISVLHKHRSLVACKNETVGLIARWNAAHPEQPVKYGSVIAAVNGVSDDTNAMIQECKNCMVVKLKVHRRRRFTVVVPDKRESLGIELATKKMMVLGITTSLECCDRKALASWNLTCPDGLEVLPGDVIVEVNGKGGTPEELLQLLRHTEGELRIVFARS